jgi:prepilin-type N-terminal cleavage/methylation domain-containing protein
MPYGRGRTASARQRGLSLLELSIAIVIAALVLFSVFRLIVTGVRSQAQGRVSAKVTALAQKALEETRLVVYNLGRTGNLLPAAPTTRKPFDPPDEAFGYTVAFYKYKSFSFPPDLDFDSPLPLVPTIHISSPDPDKTMYMIAIQVTADGPLAPDGITRRTGYKSLQVITLMHYPVYQSSIPPTTTMMPPSLHPPPHLPAVPIGMPGPPY